MFNRFFISLFFLSTLITTHLSGTPESQIEICVEKKIKYLDGLFEQIFQELQSESPEFATFVGKTTKYNNLWMDYSEEAFLSRYKCINKYLEALSTINPFLLSKERQINYEIFKRFLKESLEDYHFQSRYIALTHLSGAPLETEQILLMMPTETKEDYTNILQRLERIPTLINQIIDLLDKGLEKKLTPPQITLRSLPQRIENLISVNPETSIFFKPFAEFPSDFTQNEIENFADNAATIIKEKVSPSYQKLLDYVVSTYIPACRQTTSLYDLPNGKDLYQYCIRVQTTTSFLPSEIHAIGLSEVNRIHREMEAIISDIGFQESLSEFLNFLNNDPQFFYDTPEELVEGYREITRFIDSKLPLLFGKLPKNPYEVVPIPDYTEANQVAAFYMPGSLNTERPGRFYVNTYDLPSRAKWQMESLALHEAVPGHHLQISIAQENNNLPELRKYSGYTAYIEGWALYSEGLGKELGLYQSSYSQFGRLIEEMWRAVRLVVDTGMHALGWTREEAIAYFMEQTGVSEREVTTEIDRYLVWPGQALAYKIGELSIKKWRMQATAVLGDAFDIREFHDVLLEQGALPLDICEVQIVDWINLKQCVNSNSCD